MHAIKSYPYSPPSMGKVEKIMTFIYYLWVVIHLLTLNPGARTNISGGLFVSNLFQCGSSESHSSLSSFKVYPEPTCFDSKSIINTFQLKIHLHKIHKLPAYAIFPFLFRSFKKMRFQLWKSFLNLLPSLKPHIYYEI